MIARPYGDRAVLLEHDSPLQLAAALRGLPGVVEVVPAARTVLVRFDPHRLGPGDIVAAARVAPAVAAKSPGEAPLRLTVRYDGPDLRAVAEAAALSVEEIVARHTAPIYRVAFCGFAPGFAYLTGLDPALHLPRHREPRTHVPAGAVGIAGEFTGVYPRPSPGGWQLLGRTDAAVWQADRDPPALLRPGLFVRIVAA